MKIQYKLIIITAYLSLISVPIYAENISYEINQFTEWDSGFCSKATVINPDDYWRKWRLNFHPNGTITKVWDANYVQNANTLIMTATGKGWTESIPPYDTIKFGYCADKIKEPLKNVTFEVIRTKEWNRGFCDKVIVSNPNDEWMSWFIEFNPKGIISKAWDVSYVQNEETLLSHFSGLGWTKSIPPLDDIKFGYCTEEPINIPAVMAGIVSILL